MLGEGCLTDFPMMPEISPSHSQSKMEFRAHMKGLVGFIGLS